MCDQQGPDGYFAFVNPAICAFVRLLCAPRIQAPFQIRIEAQPDTLPFQPCQARKYSGGFDRRETASIATKERKEAVCLLAWVMFSIGQPAP
jgi:hypothetical protein